MTIDVMLVTALMRRQAKPLCRDGLGQRDVDEPVAVHVVKGIRCD